MQDAVDDGVGEVVVVKDLAPVLRVLVGREDHCSTFDVAFVDNVKEDVGSVVAVREVADFIDNEQMRFQVAHKRVTQFAIAAGRREVVDEIRSGREERIEAICKAR
jgi:hypothetical protein